MVNQTRNGQGRALRVAAWVLMVGGLVVVGLPILQANAPEASWSAVSPLRIWGRLGIALAMGVLGWWALRRSRRRPDDHEFLDESGVARVEAAIRAAEQRTSAEIRVHLASRPTADAKSDAAVVFGKLGMQATAERNGVLFHVDIPGHGIVVLGDTGIDAKVPEGFWDEVLEIVRTHFLRGEFSEGLVAGIAKAGRELAQHFPRKSDDQDELPNEVSRDQ